MSEMEMTILLILGKSVAVLGAFGILGHLVMWTLEVWWRVYKYVYGIPSLLESIRKLRAEVEK